ncbi:hypothetical protein JCM30471_12920 [Desulfuromonas carbonis]|uniref:hypothetical protein n=1 Tax=Desulfuromonas sp. DDH964 TaxID=1823759 RepID=UPI00078C0955|nr:hypothetical protein [Desulfuromonas sp. DDH964]AMV72776.1 type II secretion system protein PulP [Desulfuromonas sp. DDH964]
MKRKPLILLLLLICLGLSIAYSYWASPRQERIPRQNPPGKERPLPTRLTTPKGDPAVDDTHLHLELFQVNEGTFPGYKRNIFGSVEPPPPPPPPPPKVVSAPVVAAPPPPPPPQPTPVVQRELARFRFLGYLEKDQEKTVFLSRDKDLYLVKKGTRFGDRQEFTVGELTATRLVIQVAGDSRKIEIELAENQPLIPQFGTGGGNKTGRSPTPGSRINPRMLLPVRPSATTMPVMTGSEEAPAVEPLPDITVPPVEEGLPPDSPLPESPVKANEVGQ